MATYLKQGKDHGLQAPPEVRERVADLLEDIGTRGEVAVREYSRQFDNWEPADFRLSSEQIDQICGEVDDGLAKHIQIAADRVRRFAEEQKRMFRPLQVEIEPGIVLGHRHIPVEAVGAYVPGGRYKLISSALMSALTAKVAGVGRVVAMTPPGDGGIHPPTLYAMRLAGADEVYVLGGVQGMAALAMGVLPGLDPVDMLVGAGNAYVAEAKRQLFGLAGIDLLAGPTEILVLADETARPRLVAIDLLSQAEHGPTSPAALVTTSSELGESVQDEVRSLLGSWPTADVTTQAWADYGTIAVAADREEAVALTNAFAPEHLELHVGDPEWYETRLTNYGSLFVGEETVVTFGDKAVGTNHTLPTQRAARYTGGLWVGKFLKTVTYQKLSQDASSRVAESSALISRAEGMLGHAISAEVRFDMDPTLHRTRVASTPEREEPAWQHS